MHAPLAKMRTHYQCPFCVRTTSGFFRIFRSGFFDVTIATILPPLSSLFSAYQWVIRSRMWLHDREWVTGSSKLKNNGETTIDGFRKSSPAFEKKYAIISLGNRFFFR